MRTRIVKHSNLLACPHSIVNASHYRDDGKCRCDDPYAPDMKEWGYQWNPEKGCWE
jgi:hypothetical protein